MTEFTTTKIESPISKPAILCAVDKIEGHLISWHENEDDFTAMAPSADVRIARAVHLIGYLKAKLCDDINKGI